jgi:hypothetical protein
MGSYNTDITSPTSNALIPARLLYSDYDKYPTLKLGGQSEPVRQRQRLMNC